MIKQMAADFSHHELAVITQQHQQNIVCGEYSVEQDEKY